MTARYLNPFPQHTDIDGNPNAFYVVYFGEPNQDPIANPKAPFSDAALTIPLVTKQVLNSAGAYAQDIFLDGAYSIRIETPLGSLWRETPSFEGLISVLFVDNFVVATMESDVTLTVGDFVSTVGYTSAGDGGDNIYEIVASGTGTNDGGSFIDLSGSGHQAKSLFPGGVVNAAQFGVIFDDSTLNNTSVPAAVDYCNTSGDNLYWREDIALVSVNVPNFHNVTHRGPGAIKRGSDTWFVEGVTQGSRTIYVQSNTGADTNDGIANDFPLETEQYAIDALQAVGPLSQEAGTLQLVANHSIKTGFVLVSGDYGWITISSDDTEVICTQSVGTPNYYVNATGCTAPRYNIFLDGNNNLERAYSISNGSGFCENESGGRDIVIDPGGDNQGRALYGNNAIIRAGNTVWVNIEMIYGNNSNIQMGAVSVDGATSILGALVASRGSAFEAQDAKITNAVGRAFYAKRAGSSINAHGTSTSSGCGGVALADRGAVISIPDHVATDVGAGSSGALVTCSRARIIMNDCQVTASASHTGTGILVSSTGNMSFENSTLTDAGDIGVDVTDSAAFSGEGCSIIDSGGHGLFADKGSKAVNAINATVTGSGGEDLRCATGAVISANGCTTTNSVGTPDINDTNFSAFNTIETNKGIIWN